jgi:hypothetical protein
VQRWRMGMQALIRPRSSTPRSAPFAAFLALLRTASGDGRSSGGHRCTDLEQHRLDLLPQGLHVERPQEKGISAERLGFRRNGRIGRG